MKKLHLLFLLPFTLFFFFACSGRGNQKKKMSTPDVDLMSWKSQGNSLDTATFAGGCFWCTEAYFERVGGVKKVVSGYSGGTSPNPTYEQVSAGKTDYAEAVQVFFDPEVLSYEKLLEVFFATMDPTQLNRQGPDVGKQYRSVVLTHNAKQGKLAQDYVDYLEKSSLYGAPIVTKVEPFIGFYEAEDYHQDFYRLNPDNPYVCNVSQPKVKKFEKEFQDILKEEYKTKK